MHINDFSSNIHLQNTNKINYSVKSDKDSKPKEVYPLGLTSLESPLFLVLVPQSMDKEKSFQCDSFSWNSSWNPANYISTDEYRLIIGDHVQIFGRCERALYYGLKTFEQLFFSTNNQIPYQTIHDFPKLSLRAIHLDLKFYRPHQNYLLNQIKTLASYKINSVFIEWEDKFPFTGELSFIRHAAALTPEEKDELLSVCSDYYIEAVPLIQTLGHFEYVLKHPNWRHMREIPTTQKSEYEMFCCSHPETEATIHKIHNQVMKGMNEHASSKFIHLGLDECYYLGQCSRCSALLGSNTHEGKSEMFIDWLNKFADYYLSMGKRPIVWVDMLVRHPHLIDQLNSQIIICDWEYEHPVTKNGSVEEIDPTGLTVDWVRTWETKTMEMIKQNPPITAPYFLEQCWRSNGGKYPLNAFPYTKYFKERDFEVLCAPASQYGLKTPGGPRNSIHFPNIMHFNQAAIRTGSIGSLCTNWAVRQTPWHLVQYGFLLHAETSWKGAILTEQEFTKQFLQNFYQLPTSDEISCLMDEFSEFFTISSHFGLNYHQLLDVYKRNPIPKGVSDRLVKFRAALESISNLIRINKNHIEFIKIFFEYWVFLSEWLPLAADIEKVAQSLDEDGHFGMKNLEKLSLLSDALSKHSKKWKTILESMKSVLPTYLNSIEIADFEILLFSPLTKQLELFKATFPNMVDSIEEFVERITEDMFTRYKL